MLSRLSLRLWCTLIDVASAIANVCLGVRCSSLLAGAGATKVPRDHPLSRPSRQVDLPRRQRAAAQGPEPEASVRPGPGCQRLCTLRSCSEGSGCASCDCASVVRLASYSRSLCDLCIRLAEDGEPTNVDSLVVGQARYPEVMFNLLHHVLFAGYQLVAVSCLKGKHRSGAILSFVAHRPSTIDICIVQRSSVCMHARYPTHVC